MQTTTSIQKLIQHHKLKIDTTLLPSMHYIIIIESQPLEALHFYVEKAFIVCTWYLKAK